MLGFTNTLSFHQAEDLIVKRFLALKMLVKRTDAEATRANDVFYRYVAISVSRKQFQSGAND